MASHREALVQLGDAYRFVGLFEVALQQYEEVLRNYPESPEALTALSGLGHLRAQNRSFKLPVALLEQLVRSQPGSAVAMQAASLLGSRPVAPSGGAQ
jgi:tetratricopeptide (TPR) repeat protein